VVLWLSKVCVLRVQVSEVTCPLPPALCPLKSDGPVQSHVQMAGRCCAVKGLS
jgi:hypothetical protein